MDPILAKISLRIADKLLLLRFRDRPSWLLHVEFQLRGDPGMAERMAFYALLTRRLARSPELRESRLASVVIYLEPGLFKGDTGRLQVEGELGFRLSFCYRVVKLWEVDPRLILGRDAPGLWPFAPLLRGKPETLLVQSRERIVSAPESLVSLEERRELLAILSGLASRIVEDNEALDRLVLEIEGMGKNYVFEKLVEQGRREGRKEGIRSDILRVLSRRFGSTGETVSTQLEEIEDVPRLEEILDEAVLASTLEEFTSRLKVGGL